MLGYNYVSFTINLLIFIGILFATYSLSLHFKDNVGSKYLVGVVAILAALTYLPYGIGYAILVAAIYYLLMINDNKSLMLPAFAVIISFALSALINFIINHAVVFLPVTQAIIGFFFILGLAFLLIVILLIRR